MSNLESFDNSGRLVLRLTVGILMLFHGVAKILHPGSVDFIGSKLVDVGLPEALAWGVYVGEIVAPLMLILGIFSRVGGLIIAVNMMFAILLVHTGDVFSLTEHGGWRLELQGFYLFGAIAVALLGSGKTALRPD